MRELKGLATGIGSMPHKDAEAALDLVFKYCPQIPFWPQLPRRDVREAMVAQFSQNLPCIKIKRDGPYFSAENKEKELEFFYGRLIDNDIGNFKITQDFSAGLYGFYQRLKEQDLGEIEFIKCHVVGPFSFAASFKDEKGIALLHEPVFMQAIIKGLSLKALWQLKFFAEFGKKMLIFVDEPYLGCFGSGYTPINRQDAVKVLAELTEGIRSTPDTLIGVHCCGNTDWSIFTDISSIDIISFDAFEFLEKFILYADNLKDFLKRGGIICWGIVPTQGFSGQESAEVLVKRIKEAIGLLVKKGLDRQLVTDNLLLSPSCGLGTLDGQKSEAILKLLSETSVLLRKEA